MKKFWENYKRNLRLLAKFSRRHWKVFCISCFASSFIVTAVNFVLSFYIIDPKYFLGDDHFLPDSIKAIIVVILMHFMFSKYSGLNLNQYGVASPCRTICTVCGFVALS